MTLDPHTITDLRRLEAEATCGPWQFALSSLEEAP